MNDFNEQLATSHDQATNACLRQIYEAYYGKDIKIVDRMEYGEHQKAGIDKEIHLPNGRIVTVDEKIRQPRPDGRAFNDILLEYISNDKTGALGWVCNPNLRCDDILYVNDPLGKAYFLPTIALQAAWRFNCSELHAKYGSVRAKNNGYYTISTPVPTDVLLNLITRELAVVFPVNAISKNIATAM